MSHFSPNQNEGEPKSDNYTNKANQPEYDFLVQQNSDNSHQEAISVFKDGGNGDPVSNRKPVVGDRGVSKRPYQQKQFVKPHPQKTLSADDGDHRNVIGITNKSSEVADKIMSPSEAILSATDRGYNNSAQRRIALKTAEKPGSAVFAATESEEVTLNSAEVLVKREVGETLPNKRNPRNNTNRRRVERQKDYKLTESPDSLPKQTVSTDPSIRQGRYSRKPSSNTGRQLGRYLMCVHVRSDATEIAVVEGRRLVEHHVAKERDNGNQIDGNIYYGRVINVLPGMEAAFVDIGTPKNAVLYWGDVQLEDEEKDSDTDSVVKFHTKRIEQLLKPGQMILCQVTKNPIGLKGARLTQEISLAGRFVVLMPGSDSAGISKRLDDHERKRLRKFIDDVKPQNCGLIVRTAAAGVSIAELQADVEQLSSKWAEIELKIKSSKGPELLYSEPHMAMRVIREELNDNYRAVIIDDHELYLLLKSYVEDFDPYLAEKISYYDVGVEKLPIYEKYSIHEQLHKALDKKVWLSSGGSLIIERTEALTVIDVNTGKNVGKSSLGETVYQNNMEAAREIARQLRLRDIGGIIVIDFIDMEDKAHRDMVVSILRQALAEDKTPTQVYPISDLGLVEMTRKRIGEGLVESLSDECPHCHGMGYIFENRIK